MPVPKILARAESAVQDAKQTIGTAAVVSVVALVVAVVALVVAVLK